MCISIMLEIFIKRKNPFNFMRLNYRKTSAVGKAEFLIFILNEDFLSKFFNFFGNPLNIYAA